MLIDSKEICPMCHRRYADLTHHLIFGSAKRRLADEDKLTIEICDYCHTMGQVKERIHDNTAAEALSRMLGQAIYERDRAAEGLTLDEARKKFIERYGISYL